MKINWKAKLSSRKFWLAVAGFAVAVWLLVTAKGDKTQLITGATLAFGNIVGFLIADVVQDTYEKGDNSNEQ